MAFKEYTAEETCDLMPKELSKREKRFAMKNIKKAALKGYNCINFDITLFNADPKVIKEYFTKLHYCCNIFRNKLSISWDDVEEE